MVVASWDWWGWFRNGIAAYVEHEVTTSRAAVERGEMDFPQVTVCSSNPVKCNCDLWCVPSWGVRVCMPCGAIARAHER